MTTADPARGPSTADAAAWRPTRILPRHANYATLVAFLAWVFAVYDFILFGILLPEISGEFGWSTATATRSPPPSRWGPSSSPSRSVRSSTASGAGSE